MPVKNTIKEYTPNSFYHVYNHGMGGREIFIDEHDYNVFLGLMKKYLSSETPKDSYGREQVSFYGDIELQSYSLMPHDFHLLLHVGENARSMTDFMRRLCTSYTIYFNKRHKLTGQLLQGRFKAKRITAEPYVVQVTRYIHRTPEDYKGWPYSSINYFIGDSHSEWVRPQKVYGMYEYGSYEGFLDDHDGFDATLSEIKQNLANF